MSSSSQCCRKLEKLQDSGKFRPLILYVLLQLQLKHSLQRGGRAGVFPATVLRESSGLKSGWMEKGTAGTWCPGGTNIRHGMRHWSKHSVPTARRQNPTSKSKEIPPEPGRTSLGFLSRGHTSGVSIRPKCPGKGGQPARFQSLRGVSLARVARVTSATGCSSQVMKPQESGCKMEKVTESLVLFFFVFKQPFILQHSCLKFTELIP